MSPSANKLAKKYSISLRIAEALVEKGFRNPRAIETATVSDLRKVPGVGQALAERLKGN